MLAINAVQRMSKLLYRRLLGRNTLLGSYSPTKIPSKIHICMWTTEGVTTNIAERIRYTDFIMQAGLAVSVKNRTVIAHLLLHLISQAFPCHPSSSFTFKRRLSKLFTKRLDLDSTEHRC